MGSGAIGSALAVHFAAKNIAVSIANQRGPDSLAPLVKKLGANVTAVTLETALQADTIIFALPYTTVPSLVSKTTWAGRTVIDATNAVNRENFRPTDLNGEFSSRIIAQMLPGARLVKAFNTIPAATLAKSPEEDGARRVVFLCGDDPQARTDVAALITRLGFAPIDLGSIENGFAQQFGNSLVAKNILLK